MPNKWYERLKVLPDPPQPPMKGRGFRGYLNSIPQGKWTDPFTDTEYDTEPWWAPIQKMTLGTPLPGIKDISESNVPKADVTNSWMIPKETYIVNAGDLTDRFVTPEDEALLKSQADEKAFPSDVRNALRQRYVQLGMSPLQIESQLAKDDVNGTVWSDPNQVVKQLNLLDQEVGFQNAKKYGTPQQQMEQNGLMLQKQIQSSKAPKELMDLATAFLQAGGSEENAQGMLEMARTPVSLGGGNYTSAFSIREIRNGLYEQVRQQQKQQKFQESNKLLKEFPDWYKQFSKTSLYDFGNAEERVFNFANWAKSNPEFMKVYQAKQEFLASENPELYPKYLAFMKQTQDPEQKMWSFDEWVNAIPEYKAFQAEKVKQKAAPRGYNTPRWAIARQV